LITVDEMILQPVIVSASRSTDIPAFYADWFLERLKAGYSVWANPFNQARYRVSFADTRMIVFWSKDPKPMLERLDEMESLGFRQYYFQFTLNDYDVERLEPNVPAVSERLETFRALSKRIGKERVIWRFDPLVLTDTINVRELLCRIKRIGDALKGCTEKLVFSFVDIQSYKKVSANLKGTGCREFTESEKEEFVTGLLELNKRWGLILATCGENYSHEGIIHNKCVDDELIMRLFNDDAELMNFIGAEYDMFSGWQIKKSKKDKGQRKECGCIVSKDIGMYNTCPHLCRYCYANSSEALVKKNFVQYSQNPYSESII
jgi:hypothetical protein